MSLAAIVKALGGELHAGGARANVPGPGHGPQDRSVSLLLSGDRVVVHSFAGDDWRTVLADLRDRGLVGSGGRLVGEGRGAAAPAILRSARDRCGTALELWDAGRPITGTLSERHLRRRAVQGLSAELRHHPAVPAAIYARRGPCGPALLAAIRDPGGALRGVEVTFLAADGARAASPLARRTIGQRPPGSAVRLHPSGPELLVGEGVFTCLSAAERLGLPAWALLSTANLRQWSAPPGVEAVLLAADRGRDGERSAAVLAARLAAAGVRCRVRLPPPGCLDWNDAAVAAAGKAE